MGDGNYPVEILKPRISFQIIKCFTKPCIWLPAQQLLHKCLCQVILHVIRIKNLLFQDFLINLIWIIYLFSKWYHSTHKFIENNTDCPNIRLEGISFLSQHFRGHVMWSPDHSFCHLCVRFQNLCSTHINELWVSKFINHEIIWLKVPMNDIMRL